MIKSFSDKETEKVFNREFSVRLPTEIQRNAMRKLWVLDASVSLNDLRVPPSNHLEKLSGKRKAEYSIRVNDQWRICFSWKNGDAYDVKIEDYH